MFYGHQVQLVLPRGLAPICCSYAGTHTCTCDGSCSMSNLICQFFLVESGARTQRPAFVTDYLYRESTKKYWESIDLMKSVAASVIKERRTHPTTKKDLVNAMVLGEDPKTGKTLPDDNIINNMITFLIAGKLNTLTWQEMLAHIFQVTKQHPVSYLFCLHYSYRTRGRTRQPRRRSMKL